MDWLDKFLLKHEYTVKRVVAILIAAAIGAGIGGYFGYEQGADAGHDAGYKEGYSYGFSVAKKQGDSRAENKYKQGYEDGLSAAKTPQKPNFLDDSPSQEVSVTVYVTNKGSKYHRSWCGYLHSSSRAVSLTWATSNGYTACSRCW